MTLRSFLTVSFRHWWSRSCRTWLWTSSTFWLLRSFLTVSFRHWWSRSCVSRPTTLASSVLYKIRPCLDLFNGLLRSHNPCNVVLFPLCLLGHSNTCLFGLHDEFTFLFTSIRRIIQEWYQVGLFESRSNITRLESRPYCCQQSFDNFRSSIHSPFGASFSFFWWLLHDFRYSAWVTVYFLSFRRSAGFRFRIRYARLRLRPCLAES